MQYSIRSMLRNKRRTVLTVLTVAFSVAVMITADRYLDGMLKIWQKSSADYGTGHAQLHSIGYQDAKDGLTEDLFIPEPTVVETLLENDASVAHFTRRIRFDGLVSHQGKAIYFLGIAVEPEKERLVSPKIFSLESDRGKFLSPDEPFGAVVGRGMADALQISVGDTAALSIQPMRGGPDAINIKVVGIVELPVVKLSKRVIFLNLATIQKALKTDDRYTEIALRLTASELADSWVPAKANLFAGKKVQLEGWWQVDPYIKRSEAIIKAVLWITALLLFICAGISVLNIIYMVVAERTIEIGTLMALGAKPLLIRTLFSAEAVLIGTFGSALGLAVAHGAIAFIGVYGVSFQSPFGSGIVTIYPENDWSVSFTFSAIAISFCLLAAIAPAAKAARVEPTTAFRGQLT